jgi:DNA-binding NarL/FixJ family response regulator
MPLSTANAAQRRAPAAPPTPARRETTALRSPVPDLVPDGASSAAPVRAGPPISLVLIDDNRVLREGLSSMIRARPDFHVLASAADGREALDIVRGSAPDIVLLDFGLPDNDSLALTATVHREVPTAKVIVMGLLPAQEDVVDFVRAGASGFIMKHASFPDFVATMHAVASGAHILPPALTNSMFAQIAQNAVGHSKKWVMDSVRLTARERQVIDLLGEGLSNKEISARLNIAVHTVKSHVHNVLEKLALHSRLEVAAFSHAANEPLPRSLPPLGPA